MIELARSIKSYLKIPEESDFLVAEAEKAQYGIIEIGAWTGRSSLLLADIARRKGIPYVVVDTWLDCDLEPDKDFYYQWLDNMTAVGLLPQDFKLEPNDKHPAMGFHFADGYEVHVLRSDSVYAGRLFDSLTIGAHGNNLYPDFLFIDGDHAYESVKQDFLSWKPNLRPESTVVFHDVDGGHEGVTRFFKELGGELEIWSDGNIGSVRLK